MAWPTWIILSPGKACTCPTGSTPTSAPTSGARVIASLDFENAPLQVANFVRIVEGGDARGSGGGGGRGGRGGPAIGRIDAAGEGRVSAVVESEVQRGVAVDELPLTPNPAVRHDAPGILGLSGPNTFYLTLGADPSLDARFSALGRVVAGADRLRELTVGDEIRSIRILRSGERAQAFATDDEAFQRLLRGAGGDG